MIFQFLVAFVYLNLVVVEGFLSGKSATSRITVQSRFSHFPAAQRYRYSNFNSKSSWVLSARDDRRPDGGSKDSKRVKEIKKIPSKSELKAKEQGKVLKKPFVERLVKKDDQKPLSEFLVGQQVTGRIISVVE